MLTNPPVVYPFNNTEALPLARLQAINEPMGCRHILDSLSWAFEFWAVPLGW
jgi:hypothetical protein